MIKIGILNIGGELLSGKAVNTNAADIGNFLLKMGFFASESTAVRDDEEEIVSALKRLISKYDIVICTGGLGPTSDDITRFAAVRLLKSQGYYSKTALRWLMQYLPKESRNSITAENIQTWIPRGSRLLRNWHGTACGFWFKKDNSRVFFFPGVPFELREMLHEHLEPVLLGKAQLLTKKVWLWGMSESKLQECIGSVNIPQGVNLSILASLKGISLSVSLSFSKSSNKLLKSRKNNLELFWSSLIKRIPENVIISLDGFDLPEALIYELKRSQTSISTAESCTGGALGFLLTSIAGSSEVFHQGLITYSNPVKTRLLGVKPQTLKKSGAVSENVVCEMVKGAIRSSGSDYACSTSGIAGPGGGTIKKPVGTVWIAAGSLNKVYTRKLILKGDRDQIRWRSSYAALNLMLTLLKEIKIKKNTCTNEQY